MAGTQIMKGMYASGKGKDNWAAVHVNDVIDWKDKKR